MEEKVEILPNLDIAEFRHSMFEALEKYGVLDKLRVHLRSLMVNLIKGFQLGHDPFPQYRLEPKNQALNVLIAEYLLYQQYTYSLSVFASEIPLSSTVFDYGSTLFDMSAKFEENDTWKFVSLNDKDIALVFNAMGVPSNSNFVNNVYSMYKSTLPQSPLLCCMLEMIPGCNDANGGLSGASVVGSNELKLNKLEDDSKISIRSSYLSRNNTTEKNRKKANNSPTRKRIPSPTANMKVQKSAKESNKSRDKTKDKNAGERNIDKNVLEEMYEELHLLYASELDLLRKKDQKKYNELLTQKEIEDRVDQLERNESIKKMQKQLQKDYDRRKIELEIETKKKKKSLTVLAAKLKEQQQTLRAALKHLNQRTSCLGEKERNLHKQKIASEQAMIKKSEQLQKRIQEKIDDLQRQMAYLETDKKLLYEEKILIAKFKGGSIARKESGSQTFNDLEEILPESTMKKDSIVTMLPLLERNITKRQNECEIQTDICNINSVLMEIESNLPSEKDPSNSNITNIRVFSRDETINMLNTKVSEIIKESLGINTPKVINNNLKNIKINNTIIKEFQKKKTDHLKKTPSNDAKTEIVKNKMNRAFLGKALKETLEFNSQLHSMVEIQRNQIDNLRKLLKDAQAVDNDGIQKQQLRRTQSFNNKLTEQSSIDENVVDSASSGPQSIDTDFAWNRPKSSPISILSQNSVYDADGCGSNVGGSNSSGVYRSEDIDIQKQLLESRQTLRRLEIEAEVVEQCYQEYKERKRSASLSRPPTHNLMHEDYQHYIAPKVSLPHLLGVPAQINLLSQRLEQEKTHIPALEKVERKIITPSVVTPGIVDKPMNEFRKMYKLPNSHTCKDILGDYYKIALSINLDTSENSMANKKTALDQTSILTNENVQIHEGTSHPSKRLNKMTNKKKNEKNYKIRENDETDQKLTANNLNSQQVVLDSRQESNKHFQNDATNYCDDPSTPLKDNSIEVNKIIICEENILTKKTSPKQDANKNENDELNAKLFIHNVDDKINSENKVSTPIGSSRNFEDLKNNTDSSNKDALEKKTVFGESTNTNVKEVMQPEGIKLNECHDSLKNVDSPEKSANFEHEISQKTNESNVKNYSDEEFDETSEATNSAISVGNVPEQFWH